MKKLFACILLVAATAVVGESWTDDFGITYSNVCRYKGYTFSYSKLYYIVGTPCYFIDGTGEMKVGEIVDE